LDIHEFYRWRSKIKKEFSKKYSRKRLKNGEVSLEEKIAAKTILDIAINRRLAYTLCNLTIDELEAYA
jgi:hypothetical protein